MPSIRISQEQAQDLADGRDITIVASKPERVVRRYVVTFGNGNTFLFKTDKDIHTGYQTWFRTPGPAMLIDKGPHFMELGYVQYQPGGDSAVVVAL